MNKVILMGRLTRDPEVRYSAGENALAIARYTLAVDRRFRRDGEASADFISCVSFGRTAEFAEKYFRQGLKIAVTGRIQTGSYTNKDGQKDEIPRKPDPAGVFYVAKKLGVDYKECLYVGDSEVDVVTGKNAGVKTIAVTWGFRTKEELMIAGAQYMIDKAEKLQEYL